jgi:hypothetical protein
VDVLLVYRVRPAERTRAGEVNKRLGRSIGLKAGVRLQTWTVGADDLRAGRRTPMLVDAIADSTTVWPAGAPPLRVPFMPADAVFCAERLLAWVDSGGAAARQALQEGRWADAAARARDDIARLASAALLLTGDTRHRRRGTLRRFERRFVRTGLVPQGATRALEWAAAAYPRVGGHGQETPLVPPPAVATAPVGCELAAALEAELLVPLLDRIVALRAIGQWKSGGDELCATMPPVANDGYLNERGPASGRGTPPSDRASIRNMPRCCAMKT